LAITTQRGPDELRRPKIEEASAGEVSEKLPGIARRFISDVMKRPGPKGLRGPEGDAGGREPHGPSGHPEAPGRQLVAHKPAARSRQRKPAKKKQR
jgi:hypothetical protein